MSKGSKVVLVRFPKEELDAMIAQIASSNESRRDEPYTVSSFVRYCVQSQLRKNARGRAPRKSARTAYSQEALDGDTFDVIWQQMASEGHCDTLGHAEYTRVRSEWDKAGRPAIGLFIQRQANVVP